MIIYIVRHPETKYDRKGLLKGHKDSALTKEGKNTAKKLGRVLKDKNITKIYSSDLGRCLQTSKIINNFLQVQIVPIPNLKERNFGELNGKPVKLVEKTLDLKNADLLAPNGESFNQMKQRVLLFVKSLALKTAEGSILLVTHEGCVRAILSKCYKTEFTSNKCDTIEDFIGMFEVQNGKINLLKVVRSF